MVRGIIPKKNFKINKNNIGNSRTPWTYPRLTTNLETTHKTQMKRRNMTLEAHAVRSGSHFQNIIKK